MNKPYAEKRVLVVENDQSLREAIQFNLEMSGFQVACASGTAQALDLVATQVFDVAIIDKRLENHALASDASGIDLAEQLPATIVRILYTAFDDLENTRNAHARLGNVTIIDKTETGSGLQLVHAIDDIYNRMRLNLNLEFQPPGLDLAGFASGIELPAADLARPPTAVDLARIFQRLYFNVDTVSLSYLIPPEPSPTVSTSGSVLLKAEACRSGALRSPEVVKLCAREDAEQEAKNYKEFANYFNGRRIAILAHHSPAVSRSLGGLLYSLIETDLEHTITSYRSFYQNNAPDRIVQANRLFFEDTFGNLYRTAGSSQADLFALYAPALRLTPEKLRAVMARVLRPERPDAPQLHFSSIRAPLPNPVAWAISNDAFIQFRPRSIRRCIVHGDLHNRNILVDSSPDGLPKFWIIDLARAGRSHILRDFVELETDIKFTLLQSGDARSLLEFETALLAPETFGQPVPDHIFADPELSKAYRVIAGLRLAAAELTQTAGDFTEYYQALFVHTLNAMRLRHVSPHKKEHALLSAALLCQRLENWPDWDNEPEGALLPVPALPQPAAAPVPAVEPGRRPFERAAVLLIVLAGGSLALATLLYATGKSNVNGVQWAAILLALFLLSVCGLAITGLLSPEHTADLLRSFLEQIGRSKTLPTTKEENDDSSHSIGPAA